MNQTTKLFLSLLLGTSLSQSAVGKPKDDGKTDAFDHQERPGRLLKEALRSLDLSEEQRDKIKEIRKSNKETHQEVRSALKEGRTAMESAMKSDASKETIVSKFEMIQSLRNKMARARLDMLLSVREVLTPEQRRKFGAFMDSRRGHRNGNGKDQD